MSMDQNNSSWVTLKKVWKIIDAYRLLLLGSLVLAGASVALQLYVPILFGRAIDGILGPGQVDFAQVGRYTTQILLLVILSSLATWAMNLVNNKLAFHTVQDIRSRAGNLFTLHEQGERCVSGIQRAGDHLGAFGDKDALFRLQSVAQLRLRETGVDVQLRGGKVGDLMNDRHGKTPLK